MKLQKARLPDGCGKLQRLLSDFVESGMECAEVINEGDYRDNATMICNVRRAVRANYDGAIKVVTQEGHLYLKLVA